MSNGKQDCQQCKKSLTEQEIIKALLRQRRLARAHWGEYQPGNLRAALWRVGDASLNLVRIVVWVLPWRVVAWLIRRMQ